jgi:hypothetical protein
MFKSTILIETKRPQDSCFFDLVTQTKFSKICIKCLATEVPSEVPYRTGYVNDLMTETGWRKSEGDSSRVLSCLGANVI